MNNATYSDATQINLVADLDRAIEIVLNQANAKFLAGKDPARELKRLETLRKQRCLAAQ